VIVVIPSSISVRKIETFRGPVARGSAADNEPRDGRPVHGVHGEQRQEVRDADGRPLIVPVEVPEGSSVEGPAHGA
jgi:hypothetical protein